ncbi:putative mitochondrial intermembrane space translocase subunit Tim10 [Tothia fuscella]|uniref:Mitochondrial import inner membrane translocase subunit n=1 Tax=Tothia fuscella TaxID=1048955 RepID=A0A9P4NZY2_9PEZI|nr:putative mitochondrial intermembrane space translocase subunit Tim10 [Tothia fuscella]
MDALNSANLPDIAGMPDRDKQELQQFIKNETQKSNIQQSIHSLTDMCFRKCITAKPSSGKLDKYEEPCMQNCVDRFMDANNLILKQLEAMRTA